MRQPRLSIRQVLKGLGLFGIVMAAALAAFGLAGMRFQRTALERVILLQEAVGNHETADAMMDDMRTDVLRALQTAAGANEEGEQAVRSDLEHHAEVMRDSISANLALKLDPELTGEYGRISASLASFKAVSFMATDLAFSDPALGQGTYEGFRGMFSSLETAMDDLRDNLDARLAAAKAEGAAFTDKVQNLIVGAVLLGLLVLAATTAGAIRAVDRITAALARSRAKAQHLSMHDGLTGLPNRAVLSESMGMALADACRSGRSLAVLCLDLDRFKHVNDTLGHGIGDALLQCVADRLRANVREGDTVARLGADEFVVMQNSVADAAEAGLTAQRLVEVISAPYEVNGHEVVIGVSIGVALAPADAADAAELLKMADLALDRAKSDRSGGYRFFEPDMDAGLRARRLLEADLRTAIGTGALELHYQPLIGVASGAIAGFEALVRWRHPGRGMVSPGDFIPLAEQTGLIVPIGEWVLHRACSDAAGWPSCVSVAVNVSAVQFERPGLVGAVAGALAASGLASGRLELEITETALLMDVEATLATLLQLRDLGVRIAMDDFGTGYSSLSYLRRFPFDKIKIDQCFIRDIETSADCRAIVSAVAGLGVNLGIATTAEGVETLAQFEQLRAEGCSLVQGFYFSRPVPFADVARLLGTDWSAKLRDPAAGRRSPAPAMAVVASTPVRLTA